MERAKATALMFRHADAEAKRKAEAEAKGQKELRLMPPEHLPTTYHDKVLLQAKVWERATGKTAWNPYRLVPESVGDIDLDFISDMQIFEQWLEFYSDMEDRPPELR